MKLSKIIKIIISSLFINSCIIVSVHAGTWIRDTDKTSWRYALGSDNYYKNTWQWIDGNKDGVAECYAFDADGWLYTNTKTPDGYDVNLEGAWVVNDVIQTKSLSELSASVKTEYKKTSDNYSSKNVYKSNLEQEKMKMQTLINEYRQGKKWNLVDFQDQVIDEIEGKSFFANNAKDADAAFSVIVKNKVPALNSPEFKKGYISVEKGKNNTLNFSVRFY